MFNAYSSLLHWSFGKIPWTSRRSFRIKNRFKSCQRRRIQALRIREFSCVINLIDEVDGEVFKNNNRFLTCELRTVLNMQNFDTYMFAFFLTLTHI